MSDHFKTTKIVFVIMRMVSSTLCNYCIVVNALQTASIPLATPAVVTSSEATENFASD